MTEVFVRPNGKPYRPQKPPSVDTYHDRTSDAECVVVLRTHDISKAIELAADKIAELDLIADKAHTDWWRSVPFDPIGSGYDWNWVTDTDRGVPCVVVPYE